MPKSTSLNFTQNLDNAFTLFTSSDLQRIIIAAPNSNGTNLTTGLRTFTAALGSGTLQNGGSGATWTANVTDSRIIGPATITNYGTYLTAPSDVTTNPATVDSGSSNATWTLTAGILKTVFTAGTNDSVVKAINVISTDSSARVLSLWLSNSATGNDTMIGSVSVAASSGTNGTTANIDLIGGNLLPSLPYDTNGKRVLPMTANQILKISLPAVTAGRYIMISVMAEDY